MGFEIAKANAEMIQSGAASTTGGALLDASAEDRVFDQISTLLLVDARESTRPEPDPFTAVMQRPRSKRIRRPEISRQYATDGR